MSAFASSGVIPRFQPVLLASRPRKSLHLRAVAFAVGVAMFAGCAHEAARPRRGEHLVRVNATASAPVQAGTAFVVRPARDPGAEATLLYGEAARLVKSALMAKGLYEAPGPAQAGIIVEIEYSMETPRVSRAAPGDPAPTSSNRPNPRAPATDDMAGVRSAQRGSLEKNLVLTAREAKPAGGGTPRTLWSVELSATDSSNDLRKYLPLLAATAIDQIGVDSDGPQTVKIKETDKSVTLVRQAK